jgi:FkbM family methyltransferase
MINIQQFIKSIEPIKPLTAKGKRLIEKVFTKERSFGVHVIGRNDETEYLATILKIDGIIDDFNNADEYWKSIPLMRLNQVKKNSIILNCSTSISPVSVGNYLKKNGYLNVLNFSDFMSLESINHVPFFMKEMRDSIKQNEILWYGLYNSLCDKESRRTLIDIMRYRMTADPYFMKDYSVRIENQYFEKFMNYNSEVFIDAGGYDGDTTIEFCRRYPDYKRIHFFEPSLKNISKAKENLVGLRGIHYHNIGLSDKDEEIGFDPTAGSASKIVSTSSNKIAVNTLDEVIKEKVSFIKMDLEGWEMKALKGASNHIKIDKPKLAIAVYHSSHDLLRIPEFILSLNPNYNIYLRHYTEGWSETIMYFISA